jgi:poly(3-hydroxybutyrate) depolymerase/lysophospholipase L1-like esterase
MTIQAATAHLRSPQADQIGRHSIPVETIRMKPVPIFLLTLLRLCAIALSVQQTVGAADLTSIPAGYEPRVFAASASDRLDYYLLAPPQIEVGKKYPLVVVLHGNDANEQALHGVATSRFTEAAVRQKFPCYVFAPHCPQGQTWSAMPNGPKGPNVYQEEPAGTAKLLLAALGNLVKEQPVDVERVYLTGFAMGGSGVWDLLARRPDLWAAAVPVDGGGDPARIAKTKDVAVWAKNSRAGAGVPIAHAREMIAALNAAGGKPLLSEYGHSGPVDEFFTEPELLRWMFSQKRGGPVVSFQDAAGPFAKPPASLCAGIGYMQSMVWFANNWKNARQSWAKPTADEKGRVVFLGDSITDVWSKPFGKWTSLEDTFAPMKVKNLGLAGDLSRGVLERVQDVIDLEPKTVCLLVGINDFSFGDEFQSQGNNYTVCDNIVSNIAAIVDRLHAAKPNLPIIINTVMPNGVSKIPHVNALIKERFKGDAKVSICDAYAVFVNGDTNLPKPGYTSDNIHPVEAGYQAWTAALKPIFQQLNL